MKWNYTLWKSSKTQCLIVPRKNGIDNAYSTKWFYVKLIKKYGKGIQFGTRQGQSYIVLLPSTNILSNKKWYTPREAKEDKVETHIFVIVVKFIRNNISNLRHCRAYYSSVDIVIQLSQSFVPKLFEILMTELTKKSYWTTIPTSICFLFKIW